MSHRSARRVYTSLNFTTHTQFQVQISSECCSPTLSCHRQLNLYLKFLHISHRENGSIEVLHLHNPYEDVQVCCTRDRLGFYYTSCLCPWLYPCLSDHRACLFLLPGPFPLSQSMNAPSTSMGVWSTASARRKIHHFGPHLCISIQSC